MKTWCILPLMTLVLTGCLTEEEVVGSGKLVVKEREAIPFNKVVMGTSVGRLYIEQGEGDSVRIEADDNILELISLEIDNKTLTISLKEPKKITTTRSIKFYATMKDVDYIAVNGNGAVQSLGTLNVDELEVKISGSGTVTLDVIGELLTLNIVGSGDADIKGEVVKQKVAISGSGSFHGQDLHTKVSDLTVSGSGNALVYANDSLKVQVYGSGSVRYKGHPKVDQTIDGSGIITGIE